MSEETPLTLPDRTLEARVARTETEIASLAATVKTLAHTVENSYKEQREGFRLMHSKMDNLTDRQAHQGQTNWPFVLGSCMLVLGLVGAIGTFIVLHTTPIKEALKEDHDILMARVAQLPEDYERFGYQKAKMEFLEKLYFLQEARQHAVENPVSGQEKATTYLRSWLKDVDANGSRVHNLATPDLADSILKSDDQ